MKLRAHASVCALSRLVMLSLAAILADATLVAAKPQGFPHYNSRIWRVDDGLPDNVVQAVAQTPDGFLWVGTRSGLARFDGISFTLLESKTLPEIKKASITDLCVDRHGALWIATDSAGLACLANGKLSHFGTTNGLAGNELTALCEAADGSIWVGTTVGVSRYKDGRFVNYTTRNGLLSPLVNSIQSEADGTMWIATAAGLNSWKEGAAKFAVASAGSSNSIRAVCRDKSGRLWIGSSVGVSVCDHEVVRNYDTGQGLSDHFISALCTDRQGEVWIGTYSGLDCFREGKLVTELNNEGAPFDKVNALFEDREGNLWVGSREGLIRLNPKYFFTYTKQQGLTHDNIMSVLEDHNGNVWVGTWGGGLDRLDNGKVTAFGTRDGFPNDLILALCEAKDGGLWIGTDYEGGVVRFKDGKCSRYTDKDGLFNAPIRVIDEDHDRNVWIGTSRGLNLLKEGKISTCALNKKIPYNTIVRAICEDWAGNVWVGTEGALNCWSNGQFITFTTTNGLTDDAVLSLYADQGQNLWIGTANAGLNRLHNGHFTGYTSRDGLFNDQILSILDDDHGWFWMSSPRGIFRVRKTDLDSFDEGIIKSIPCVSYGKVDGMESMLCNGVAQPSGWKSRDGRLWFPTTKGLVTVVSQPTINNSPPPVYIEEFIADKHRADADPSGPIEIPPGRGELEFRYTALSLSAPEKNRFAYKLEDVDREWTDAGMRRAASYYNIAPGHYTFHVIACNNDGVWNETGAALSFVLLPHFWETWWFRTLAVLSGAALVGGTVRYISWRKWRQKLAVLELQHSVEKDRARIARDIHDDLGSTLTQITLLSELTLREATQPVQVNRHAEQIAHTARELVQSMDEIVWAINPRNDNLPRLAGYLLQYAEKHFSGTSLRCRFDSPEDLPEQNVSAELRHHLFLTVKEALNNTARHAGATEVWLRLKKEGSELQIAIEDNGRGFDSSSLRDFGNGLANMKQRMQEIGGAFELISAPGAGTKIRLRVSLK